MSTEIVVHSARKHRRLSPSGAYIWSVCYGQPNAVAHLPPESGSTPAANQGTCAHELANRCLETGREAAEFYGVTLDAEPPEGLDAFHDTLEADGVTRFSVDEEMVEGVQMYVDYCNSLNGSFTLIEQGVECFHVHPEIAGTADYVSFDPETGILEVPDLKFGKGKYVEIDGNPQPVLYATGAEVKLPEGSTIVEYRTTIVQPRIAGRCAEQEGREGDMSWKEWGRIRTWHYTPAQFADRVWDLSEDAARTDDADAPLKAGDHCQFCRVAATCKVNLALQASEADDEFTDATIDAQHLDEIVFPEPEHLSPERMGQILRFADRMNTFVTAVQAHANREAHAGRMPDGFKFVPKRAVRQFREQIEEELVAELVALHDVTIAEIYEDPSPPKLRTAPGLEKKIGKKRFRSIERDLVTKISPGLNLVPVEDLRPAKLSAKAEDEFEDATAEDDI